jgi:hypothetical protein
MIRSFKVQYFYWILFTLLFSVVLFRALLIPLTHDESVSLTIVQGDDAWVNSANHHILNTHLMKASCVFLGTSELALRLPNVIAFILFYWSVILIINHYIDFKSKSDFFFLLLTTTSLVFCNMFMLDFFSLARGYGLSIGLTATSFYFYWRGINQSAKKWFYYYVSVFFVLLSAFANLSMLLLAFILIAFIGIEMVMNVYYKKVEIKHALIMIGLFSLYCIPVYFLFQRIFMLKAANMLYFGVDSLSSMFSSLISSSLYFSNSLHGNYVYWFLIFLLVLGLISFIWLTYIQKIDIAFWRFIGIFALVMLGFYAQHHLLGNLYPTGRTITYLIPYIGAILGYLFFKLVLQTKQFKLINQIVKGLVFVSSTIFIIHFVSVLNFEFFYDWKYDAMSKGVYQEVKQIEEAKSSNGTLPKRKVVLMCDWQFKPVLEYYFNRDSTLNVTVINKNEEVKEYDYLYEFNSSNTLSHSCKNINNYQLTNSSLFKCN